MNYRSYYDMSLTVWRYISKLPIDYDLIVGVPQSGMIPATMLSSYLKVRLSSLNLFLRGSCMTSGRTRTDQRKISGLSGVKNVLIIDDSIYSGKSIREAKALVSAAKVLEKYALRIDYAAVYSLDGKDKDVLFSMEVCPAPRVFQWNIFNHPSVTHNSCYDIDGVLCGDPSPEQNDDGPEYRKFIATAARNVNIKFPIGAIISSRLEKYRGETLEWLKKNGFKCDNLILLDMPSKKARIDANAHAPFKAEVYRNRPETLFVESNWGQALEIARLSGKDVFCTETMSYVQGSADEQEAHIGLLQKLLDEAQKCKQALDEEHKAFASRIDELLAENKKKDGELHAVDKIRCTLSAEVDRLRTAEKANKDTIQKFAEIQASLSDKINMLSASNKAKDSKLRSMDDARQALEDKLEKLIADNKAFVADNATMVSELEAKLKEAQETIGSCNAAINEAKSTVKKREGRISELKVKLKATQEAVDRRNVWVAEARSAVERRDAKITELKEKLKATQEAVDRRNVWVADAKSAIERCGAKIAELETALKAAQLEVDKCNGLLVDEKENAEQTGRLLEAERQKSVQLSKKLECLYTVLSQIGNFADEKKERHE